MRHRGGVFDIEVIDQRPGLVTLAVSGVGARQTFQHEGGGHRWQRIPPTEKRGRVQTSTVTVAVLDPDAVLGQALDLRDVEIVTARGSGPGGQNRNKTESCVVATHRPSGLQVRIDNERSQHQNKAMAYKVLAARLYETERGRVSAARDDARKQQVGTGQRGDKVRTYRTQDDQVTDHRTGVKMRLSRWYNGDW
jgi:peptide chain release factor 1